MENLQILIVADDGITAGDELCRRALAHETRETEGVSRPEMVSRKETGVYDEALRRAWQNCKDAGYGFELVDASQCLIQISIKRNAHFTQRIRRYVRVVRRAAAAQQVQSSLILPARR
jgi:hypothetical protein